MPDFDRRFIIILSVTAAIVLLAGFAMGRVTAGTSDAGVTAQGGSSDQVTANDGDATSDISVGASALDGDPTNVLPPDPDTPADGVPTYGTDAERDQMVADLTGAGIVGGTTTGILKTADQVCFDLERLQAQKRNPAFAVRVVWNESLGNVDSRDLATFGVVFHAAPSYLCPNLVAYGERIGYWLGF